MKNFAIIGVGGFVALRHLKAIKENNCNLLASLDISDSVGVIDNFFPQSKFFTDISRFERYLTKLNGEGLEIDYISICTPNHLHDFHSRLALRNYANVICEKPLVTNTELLSGLFSEEKKFNKKIYCLLQLRLNEKLKKIKKTIQENKFYDCELFYNTPRGNWYDFSWKSDEKYSGGIFFNIGIHLFDILVWLFGECKDFLVHDYSSRNSSGILYFKNAKVSWKLSLNFISNEVNGRRILKINDEIINLSGGFESNHSRCYKEILNGNKDFLARNVTDSIYLINSMRKQFND